MQEFGVDEADIIKNDGKYIYMIRQNSVRIIETNNGKLTPVANFEVEKEGFYPREMYVDGDILTLIGNYSEEIEPEIEVDLEPNIIDEVSGLAAEVISDIEPAMRKMAIGIAPGGYYSTYNRYKQMTTSVTFDVSNRAKPTQTRMVSVEGNYQSSRKIDGIVYLVTNKYQDNFWGQPRPIEPFPMPVFRDTAFESEKIVGECGTVDYMPNFETPNYLIVAAIDTNDLNEKVGRKMILGSGNQIYASAKNLYVTKNKYWYGWGQNNTPTTEIYKFSLNGTEVQFEEKGEVIGTVLNQFSMSEDADENFRIATQENKKGARMTILNKKLVRTGFVKNIAPSLTTDGWCKGYEIFSFENKTTLEKKIYSESYCRNSEDSQAKVITLGPSISDEQVNYAMSLLMALGVIEGGFNRSSNKIEFDLSTLESKEPLQSMHELKHIHVELNQQCLLNRHLYKFIAKMYVKPSPEAIHTSVRMVYKCEHCKKIRVI